MGKVFVNLSTGDWITRERIRLWALAVLVVSLSGIGVLLATSDGLNDYQGRPYGSDMVSVCRLWIVDFATLSLRGPRRWMSA